MSPKIAIVGTGANGTSIGADLTRGGHDVSLIDQWPENVQALRRRGARVQMPGEILEVPVRAFHLCDVCTFTEGFDIVFLLVKAYDTRWASHLIAPYLKPNGLMVGVQNGMTTNIVADAVGVERTLGCVIEISSEMFEPGIVTRDSPPDRSWFAVGSISPATRGREVEAADLLRLAGAVEIVDEIEASKWMKLVSNATTVTPSAILGLPLHEAVALPGMRELMLRSGQEAFDTGLALGHRPAPIFGFTPERIDQSNRIVESLLDAILSNFTLPTTKTGVLQDWMKGRRSEARDMNGLVAAEAARIGRQAPVNAALAELAARVESGTIKPRPQNLELLLRCAAMA